MTSPTKIGAITNEIRSFMNNTPNQGQVAINEYSIPAPIDILILAYFNIALRTCMERPWHKKFVPRLF